MKLKKQIGSQIRSARKEIKITQAELSNISKVELVSIGKIERGELNTTLNTLERIFSALNKKIIVSCE
jgi:predicted transcriptional regulator